MKEQLSITEWPHNGEPKPPKRDAAHLYKQLTKLLSQCTLHGYKTAAREELINLGLLPLMVFYKFENCFLSLTACIVETQLVSRKLLLSVWCLHIASWRPW